MREVNFFIIDHQYNSHPVRSATGTLHKTESRKEEDAQIQIRNRRKIGMGQFSSVDILQSGVHKHFWGLSSESGH